MSKVFKGGWGHWLLPFKMWLTLYFLWVTRVKSESFPICSCSSRYVIELFFRVVIHKRKQSYLNTVHDRQHSFAHCNVHSLITKLFSRRCITYVKKDHFKSTFCIKRNGWKFHIMYDKIKQAFVKCKYTYVLCFFNV